jgi:hypothetical protein
MRILVACEFSGVVRRAFEAKGHDVISCDILPSDDNSPYHYQGPVEDLIEQGGGFDLMIAHPPCTHLASSGARHFAAKRADGRQQQEEGEGEITMCLVIEHLGKEHLCYCCLHKAIHKGQEPCRTCIFVEKAADCRFEDDGEVRE